MGTGSTSGAQRRDMTSPAAETVVVDAGTTAAAVPAGPPPLVWSFRYEGPVAATDDRTCEMCNSAAMKKCAKRPDQHGDYNKWLEDRRRFDPSVRAPESKFHPGRSPCSCCHAAEIGYCPNHAGVGNVLAGHPARVVIDPGHAPTFEIAKKAVLDWAATLPADVKRISVTAQAQQDQPDAPFAAIQIHVVAHK